MGGCIPAPTSDVARKRHSVPTQADDPRARRSLVALQNAFLELIEHKNFDDITIKEITDGAGVSYPTFFRRCANKTELLNHIATDEVRKLLSLGKEAIESDDASATSLSMFEYVQSRRKLWTTLLTGGAVGAIHDEFRRISVEISEDRYPANPHVPVDLAISLVTNGIITIFTWWLRQPDGYPAEDASKLYDELVVGMFMDRRSRRA